ncbi:MAG: DUF2189 domain-containing protein [Gammaproteobacteria bacterium]|nr:DUF2189 domain-containing protein [Gammaproteobacteria bacterium]
MAQTLDATSVDQTIRPEIHKLSKDAPYRWLRMGWQDFRSAMGPSLSLGLLFVIAGYAITMASWNTPVLAITFVTGFLLVAPALSLGFYALSRQLGQGKPANFKLLFTSWRDYGWAVLLFGILLGVVMVAWGRLTGLIMAVALPSIGPYSNLLSLQTLATPEFVVLYMSVGLILAAIVFSLSVVSIPMLMDRKVDILTAAYTSARAVKQNPGVMLRWAAIIAVLTFAAMAAGFIGLLISMPLIGHASWHAYRETVAAS